MVSPSKTRNEEALAHLRADILNGRLIPGQKLAFADLCARYAVSVGVIREALSRLVEQDLVRSAPQQGFFVAAISRADLVYLTEARCEIEPIALRHAIAEGDIVWESEVVAAHHRLANASLVAPDAPDRLSEEWAERHSTFHETLLLGCENPRLRAIATELRASAELYRRWSFPLDHEQNRDIAGEHAAIVDAILARDPDLAARLLVEHISLTTELLLESEAIA
ncbi:GntR family transcriptional regulator [Subtercola lobariae]|uniref:GntR family transcriptional regulator n=1 Tax=Subtercola lobariae TaxID=1588641 RepID=A0A917B928_9MICO|nr:FCD domain-containing protein [Subtercola lobariae]GGF30939.1 GntR family transcriptional regulator [Subtercola lobariae]